MTELRDSILRPEDPRAEPPPPKALRRYYVGRYGSLGRVVQSFRDVCDGYRRIGSTRA